MTLLSVKKGILRGIRTAHAALLDRGLPRRLALYMHSVEASDEGSLEECVAHLRNSGYRFVQLEEFLNVSGANLAFLSFDDNYRTWYQVLPLLDRLDLRATFYVNTLPIRDRATIGAIADYFDSIHHCGERVPLDTSEIRSIRQAGHTIAAHTHAHTMLTALPQKEAEGDILRCKQILEEILGEEICHFSYPFGMRRHFNRQLLEYCQRIGFRTVASAIPGLQHGEQGPLQVNRTLWRLDSPVEFNLQNLRIDGRVFERLTGLSAVG